MSDVRKARITAIRGRECATVANDEHMMPGRRRMARGPNAAAAAALAGVITVLVAACGTHATPTATGTHATQSAPATQGTPAHQPVPAPTSGPWVGPYDYLAAGGPSPAEVMKATGIRRFTLAFIVSDGGCQPVWDNGDPLTG